MLSHLKNAQIYEKIKVSWSQTVIGLSLSYLSVVMTSIPKRVNLFYQLDGSFADPCTCRRYYTCVDFRPIKSFCPSGLYWDDIKKFCTYKNEAVCGPVASTPAPPTTTPPPDSAEKCDEEKCTLPYCFCSKVGLNINSTIIQQNFLPKNANPFDIYSRCATLIKFWSISNRSIEQ